MCPLHSEEAKTKITAPVKPFLSFSLHLPPTENGDTASTPQIFKINQSRGAERVERDTAVQIPTVRALLRGQLK